MEHQSVKAITSGEDKPIEIPCQSVEDGVESVQNESEGDCSKDQTEHVREEDKLIPEPSCYGLHVPSFEGCYTNCCGVSHACRISTEEAKDDLQGLVEPEPTWNQENFNESPSVKRFINDDKGLEKLLKAVKNPIYDQEYSDDEIWGYIAQDVQELRERAHKRVDDEITNKFLQLMGCGNASVEGLEGSYKLSD